MVVLLQDQSKAASRQRAVSEWNWVGPSQQRLLPLSSGPLLRPPWTGRAYPHLLPLNKSVQTLIVDDTSPPTYHVAGLSNTWGVEIMPL